MNGKQLGHIISQRGIKQKWVADKLNVSASMVNQWIKETRPISDDKAKELKELLTD